VRRLLTPEDAHVVLDNTPEGRADAVLYDLGLDDGSGYARWAAEKRDSFGPVIGPRLVAMHEAVKAMLEAMPPREWPQPDPDSPATQSWARAIAKVNAHPEAEKVAAYVEALRRQIALFADEGGSPAERKQIEIRITLAAGIDETVKAELLAALAQAAPPGDR
jgi:hypothetical protein